MTIQFPEGVASAGKQAYWFVEAIAAKAAPKLTELGSGSITPLQCAVTGGTGLNPTVEVATITDVRHCSRTSLELPGRKTTSIEAMEFVWNPQTFGTDAQYAYVDECAEGVSGFIVQRSGLDYETALAVGQIVNVFPIVWGPQVPVKTDPTQDNDLFRYSQKPFLNGEPEWNVAIVA